MIHIFAVTEDYKILENPSIHRLEEPDISWYWMDFDCPTEDEIQLLQTYFHFHPLAIEDCLHFLQRPKHDFYGDYDFFVLHTLNQSSLEPEEVDVFIGASFIVTFHGAPSKAISEVRQRLVADESIRSKGPMYIHYLLLDNIVDEYFPVIYQLEDDLGEIESAEANRDSIEEIYQFRSKLLKMRRTILPMQELLYRILNSERLVIPKEERMYFMDIYDHLLKLTEMIELNREITADIRGSYISINSNRMNSIMLTLTVITSIFIPLTLITGIYGMNFEYMPELSWHYGYFGVLGVMFLIAVSMAIWLWRKGWFK